MPVETALKLHAVEPNLPVPGPASDPTPDASAIKAPTVKRLIKLVELFAALLVGRSTGHRLLAAGKIGPKAIRLTHASVRFDGDEVDAWLSTRKPDGNLHDARSWPPVWELIQRKRNLSTFPSR